MTYREIIRQVSEDTGLPRKLVDSTYKAYWRTIRQYVSSLPLKDNLTDSEFSSLRPNVNIPSIGKLCVTPDRYKAMKLTYKTYLKRKEDASHKED